MLNTGPLAEAGILTRDNSGFAISMTKVTKSIPPRTIPGATPRIDGQAGRTLDLTVTAGMFSVLRSYCWLRRLAVPCLWD